MINSSSVTSLSLSTPYIARFADFTIISCAPPKCGPAGGLKSYLTPLSAVACCIFSLSSWLQSSFSSLTAPTKLVPQSLTTSFGTPLRLVKRVKAFKNVSVSRPHAISRCTALADRQVKTHNHLFNRFLPRPWIVIKGPSSFPGLLGCLQPRNPGNEDVKGPAKSTAV